MMLIPLPDELEATLKDLSECGPYVDDNQFTDEERTNLIKLKTLGLVAVGWVVTPSGRQRVENKPQD